MVLEPIMSAPTRLAPPLSHQQQQQYSEEQQRPTGPPVDAGPPSTIIVLRNVVPPGSVDESLDEEIGIECSKFGEVDE